MLHLNVLWGKKELRKKLCDLSFTIYWKHILLNAEWIKFKISWMSLNVKFFIKEDLILSLETL